MKFNWIYSLFNAVNKNWTSRIFTLILIASITYSAIQIFNAKGKAKCEDCRPYQKIAESLIDALNKAPKETSYEPVQSAYQYAVYFSDTTKPMTQAEWNRYKDSVAAEAKRKLDSLLKKKQ